MMKKCYRSNGMKKYSEVEKVVLRSVFNRMLEEGMDYFTAETAELFNVGDINGQTVQRKLFYIRILEIERNGRDFEITDQE